MWFLNRGALETLWRHRDRLNEAAVLRLHHTSHGIVGSLMLAP